MDRVGDEGNAEPEATQEQAIQVMDMEIPRQPRPEPSDGEVRSDLCAPTVNMRADIESRCT